MEGVDAPKQAAKPGWKTNLPRILALVFVVALSVILYINRDQISQLGTLGYPGIFLVNLLASATIILPMPGALLTTMMGAVFNPFWVGVAAGSGAALGELSGYLTGFSGQAVVERVPAYERIEGWIKNYGYLAILALAILPLPLFDMAGMIAGALKMPFWRFLLWCWIGKVIKMLIFAFGGAAGGNLLPVFP